MSVRITMAAVFLLFCCGVCRAETAERWNNFAEDGDLRYFMDQKSIISLPDNVFIFWVKAVPKNRDYFKEQYNQNNVAYMFTSYELDCAVSSYRVRGTIFYDKHRKEISKALSEGEGTFEPVPPESMLELAQEEVCSKNENHATEVEEPEHATAPSARPAAPETPSAPQGQPAPEAPEEPALH